MNLLKNKKILLLIIITTSFVLLVAVKISSNDYNFLNDSTAIFAFSAVTISISSVFYDYLSSIRKERGYGTEKKLEEQLSEIKDDLDVKIANLSTVDFREEIDKSVNETVKNYTLDKLIGDLKSKFTEDLENTAKLNLLNDDFKVIIDRFRYEIERLRRNATVNLFIGVPTTAGAIVVLVITLWEDTKDYDIDSYLLHIIPRITLSIFIELFSFFFLKMYRRQFEEIKYYNNELTNIELKIMAVKTALTHNSDSRDRVIDNLVATERNFILKKDESTAEIKKFNIEMASSNKAIEALTGIFQKAQN